MPKSHDVVLIEGDGIGPEVAAAAREVLDAAGAPLAWQAHPMGAHALEQAGDPLPATTVEAIQRAGIALKGPCTTPVGKGFTSVNVALRKELDLYGAVRPVRSLDGVQTRFENVDLVVVRENTEGLYSGIENEITKGVITSIKVATETACMRIIDFAFNYARERGRKRVSAFHKANIMKMSDGLFIRCGKAIAERYPDIEYDEHIIDAGCMRLVQDPSRFDVLVMENLYGDVVSDLCAGLVGGLGVVPGSNIGKEVATFEAVHGSAPDIAGKGVANPLALIMSGVMMLNHLADTRGDADCRKAGDRIKQAYNEALVAGEKTRDLGGELNTKGFVEALVRRIKA